MKNTISKILAAGLASLACCATVPAAAASPWPAGAPINYVVPYPPGGTTDILGRNIAQLLGKALPANIIVENKAGATGTIGSGYVARAKPDGYTMLGTSIGPQAIVPHFLKNLPYDPVKSLDPVILIGTIPHILVVNAGSPYKTLDQLVAAGKADPKALAYSSGGAGTILHMQGELLKLKTGMQAIHIPYKGDTPALQAVLGKQVSFMFAPVPAALPLVQAGKLRALAVTSAHRLASLQNVPTMKEDGISDFTIEQWQAIYVPAGTPKAVVSRLNLTLNDILKTPHMTQLADKLKVTLAGGTPQDLAKRQRQDFERWGQVIAAAHITLN